MSADYHTYYQGIVFFADGGSFCSAVIYRTKEEVEKNFAESKELYSKWGSNPSLRIMPRYMGSV